MDTVETKDHYLRNALYLSERITSSDEKNRVHKDIDNKWLINSGLSEDDFISTLIHKGISYEDFLNILENKNSPSSLSQRWIEEFNLILNQTNSNVLINNIESADIGLVILPFTSYFVNEVRKKNNDINLTKIDFEKFLNSCEKYLFFELKNITDKVIILEFHKLKDQLMTTDKIFDLNTFKLEYLSDMNYIKNIFYKYPVLSKIATEITLRTIVNVNQLIKRYLNDYEEIIQCFFKEEMTLESASFGVGDSHKDGQTVAILKFESGEQLVYKPRSLSTDISFQKLLDWINLTDKVSLKLNNGKSLSKKNYGWQKFIKNLECQSEEEIHNYYYRLGAFTSVFHLLKSNDIHYENLVADGSNPRIIDLETIFSNSIYTEDVLEYPQKELSKTVLSSGLIPTGQMFGTKIDFDSSGIAGKPNQESENMTGWVMIEDENGDYLYKNANFVTTNTQHLVFYKNKMINPEIYIEDFLKGFEDVYQLFIQEKSQLLSLINTFFEDIECRIVLRPTFMYSRFLIASHHPTLLKNGMDREELLQMLWNIVKTEKRFSGIVESEIQDLLNNDVPYFTYKIDSNNLLDSRGKEIEYTFDKSSLERVQDQINELSIEDMNNQLNLLRLSIEANSIRDIEANQVEKMPSHHNLNTENNDKTLLTMTEEIGDFLVKNSINDSQGKFTSWAGVENIQNKFSLQMLDFSLYNGTLGINVFLGQLYSFIPKEAYKKTIYKNIEYLKEMIEKVEGTMTASIFNGLGSFVYSLYLLSRTLKDNELKKMGYMYLLQIYEVQKNNHDKIDRFGAVENDPKIDLMDGHAGIIMLALNIYKLDKEEQLLEIAEYFGEELIQIMEKKDNQKLISGLAHGTSGIVLALSNLYKINRDYRIKYIVEELIEYENSNFDSASLNWLDLREHVDDKVNSFYWCHGAPGILLSRVDLENNFKDSNSSTVKIINQVLDKTLIMDRIGMCHGIFGNLDILTSLSIENPDYICKNYIKEIAVKTLNEVKVQSQIQGMMDRGMIGLLLGVSGIGYSLLRIEYPDNVPSILKLDLLD